MYKMIVVDDEKIIRDTLINTFNWDEFGIVEIFEASDGEDALAIIKQKKPDIVLTDIKMPVIDGLQLSSLIKEQFENTVIIVLSGFDEFALVKRALNIGVFDYLLKPIREDELKAVMKKTVELVEKNISKKINDSVLRGKIIEGNMVIREKVLNSLIMNNYKETEPTCSKLNELKINLKFERFFTSIFYLKEESKELCAAKGFDIGLLVFSVNNIADECCRRLINKYELFTTTENNVVLMADNLEFNSYEVFQLMSQIRECIRNFLNVDIMIGISKNHSGISRVKTSYDEASEDIEKKLYFGYDDVIISDKQESKAFEPVFKEYKKPLINNIYSCDNEKVNSIIDDVFNQAMEMKLPIKQVRILNVNLISCILDIANEIGYEIYDIMGDSKNIYEKVDEFKSIEKFKTFIKNIVFQMTEAIRRKNSVKKKKTIDKVLKYIDEHFNEEITLYTISETFYFDYTNLSKMFKEDVGKLFSKYLIETRINKSKELLKASGMKIYEISEAVGYSDVRYFTKLFKEFEGITPMEYRKIFGLTEAYREEDAV